MKHTIDLKDTIEYKKIAGPFLMVLITVSIIFAVILGVFISATISMEDIKYSTLFILVTLLVYSPFFFYCAYIVFKMAKLYLNLKRNYDQFTEIEIKLGIPIDVNFNAVAYILRIPLGENRYIEMKSERYSKNSIKSDRMLIGYNLETNSAIFLKNL